MKFPKLSKMNMNKPYYGFGAIGLNMLPITGCNSVEMEAEPNIILILADLSGKLLDLSSDPTQTENLYNKNIKTRTQLKEKLQESRQ